MRYFATRHGHVGPREYYNDDVLYTHGDPPLTDSSPTRSIP